jgi:DNA modification methylase
VLDPFAGAGTTWLVAHRMGREFVGIELNPAYAAMARKRVHADAPLLVGGA